jgi:hypothetical protein
MIILFWPAALAPEEPPMIFLLTAPLAVNAVSPLMVTVLPSAAPLALCPP